MVLAITFILEQPGCPSCSCVSTACLPFSGTNTRAPHRTQPSCTDSSFALDLYGFIASAKSPSTLAGHPCSTYFNTLASTRSSRVHRLISSEDTGLPRTSNRCKRLTTSVGGDSSKTSGCPLNGNLLNPSALPFMIPGLCLRV